jgi:hypothetical protein
MIGPGSHPARAPHVLARAGGDSETTILLNPETGEYYTLEGVGVRVWELCDGSRGVSDVVAVICEEFDAPAETVEADVIALLEELASEKLVRANG